MKLSEIAAKLGTRLEPPDADAEITGIAAIETAAPGQIAFVDNPKYTAAIQTTQASAIIVDDKFPPVIRPTLRVKNPRYAYLRVVEFFHRAPVYERAIHATAVIHPTARIGANASIGAYVVIDAGVEIGEGCTIRPQVVVERDVKIGGSFFSPPRCSIREGSPRSDNRRLH